MDPTFQYARNEDAYVAAKKTTADAFMRLVVLLEKVFEYVKKKADER